MSVLQYPDAINAPDLQVWNNAAFDNEESFEGFSQHVKNSWSVLHLKKKSDSLESGSGKENLSPVLVISPVSVKSSTPIKSLHPNSVVVNLQSDSLKLSLRDRAFIELPSTKTKRCVQQDLQLQDDRKIDDEIEEIEKEIKRLTSRLDALWLKKEERNLKVIERRGRIVPSKFMEAKHSFKETEVGKKAEETPLSSVKLKINRRGVSLGPKEIISGIAGSRFPGKLETTPVKPIQSLRKSCFWKLQDVDERKERNERRKSMTVSPKLIKTASKIPTQKQAAPMTVASKRSLKKEGVVSSLQPRKLFKEVEKSVSSKKPFKSGRVVTSRYNQISSHAIGDPMASDARKRPLPEIENDESERIDKKRQGREGSGRKKWEIPNEIVVYRGEEDKNESPVDINDELPRIRTVRCADESPRDSGKAKRVAELVGRKSYFCEDVDMEIEVRQALNFEEEE